MVDVTLKKYCAFLKPSPTGWRTLQANEVCDIFQQAGMINPEQEIAAGIIAFLSSLTTAELPEMLRQALALRLGSTSAPDVIVKTHAEVYESIAEKNLFMVCVEPNRSVFRQLPAGYSFRTCRHDELEVWIQVASEAAYTEFLAAYYQQFYASRSNEFFSRCTFVVNSDDRAVASCFLWLAYQQINTIAFLRVLPEFEGQGLGRSLLSELLREADYPIYLHTHPTSYRAIKLYSDLGFQFVDNPVIGDRHNNLVECLPFLHEVMPEEFFRDLEVRSAPQAFLDAASSSYPAEF